MSDTRDVATVANGGLGAILEEPPPYDPAIGLSRVTREISAPIGRRPNGWWWAAFIPAVTLLTIGAGVVTLQLNIGLGLLGIMRPVMWGTYITNFVFWVGIAHAGTLISAILFLFRQKWRTAINRSSEAMTIFAVICAGLFPLLHIGRTMLAYWLIPYPNPHHLWVNFRSPLIWDVFAVSTYATISLLFWYQGMIPDLATIRDQERRPLARKLYGVFAQSWKGTARDWHHYEAAYGLMAAIATPLVLSVHSVVSSDFAVSSLPGWHDTIFPPYFVAGAIFSGFAMVITIVTIMRKAFELESYITLDVMELMGKIVLVTSSMVTYAYITEVFMYWYSQDPFENHIYIWIRFFGPFAWAGWLTVFCNCIQPNILWFRSMRRNPLVLFVVSILVNVGMWFERYVIIVTSLSQSYLSSDWRYFAPTVFDILVYTGSLGLFFTLFLLFARFVPTLAISEVKHVLVHQVAEDTPGTGGSHG